MELICGIRCKSAIRHHPMNSACGIINALMWCSLGLILSRNVDQNVGYEVEYPTLTFLSHRGLLDIESRPNLHSLFASTFLSSHSHKFDMVIRIQYNTIKYNTQTHTGITTNTQTKVGRESSVGTATRYGLGGLGIESRWGRDFPHPFRRALGPTQPLIQWVPGLLRG